MTVSCHECRSCIRLIDRVRELEAKNRATSFVLTEREAELLKLKGPCSNETCPLHYAHSGPCDTGKQS